jgi:hypothetical protein
MSDLHTDAWLLRGISSIPGELSLRSEVLSFTASGSGSAWPFQLRKLGELFQQPALQTELNAGLTISLFAWPVREISASMPWYYFSGGITLQRRGVRVRLGFVRPVDAGRIPGRALAGLAEVGAARECGKLWASTLTEAARPQDGGHEA